MDVSYLLDILGNENRRNILMLLSYRPCYVTEISEELKVSPKAIIDHLKLLEDAGLIQSFYDEQKRKYYEIADNVRIEISISPMMFDMNVSKISIDDDQRILMDRYGPEMMQGDMVGTLRRLCKELQRLNWSNIELREAQMSLQGRISEVTGMCVDLINKVAADQIEAEILYMLIRGPTSYEEIASKLSLQEEDALVELARLQRKGLVICRTGRWSIL